MGLRSYLIPALFSQSEWPDLERTIETEVDAALERTLARPEPDASRIREFVFAPAMATVSSQERPQNGFASTWWRQFAAPWNMSSSKSKAPHLRRGSGIQRRIWRGRGRMQEEFGDARVFDTSLSEEGIIGSAVGLASQECGAAPNSIAASTRSPRQSN